MIDTELLQLLPVPARTKLKRLDRQAQQAFAAARALADDVHAARADYHRRLATAQNAAAPRPLNMNDCPGLVEDKAEIDRLYAEQEAAGERAQEIAAPLGGVEQWLRDMAKAQAKIVVVKPPVVKPSANPERDVARTRKRGTNSKPWARPRRRSAKSSRRWRPRSTPSTRSR